MSHGKSVAIRIPLTTKARATEMAKISPTILVADWWRLKKELKEARSRVRELEDDLNIFAPSNIEPEI